MQAAAIFRVIRSRRQRLWSALAPHREVDNSRRTVLERSEGTGLKMSLSPNEAREESAGGSSGPGVAAGVGVAGAGVAGAVAAPTLVTAAVSTLGFTSSGIAAGSTAAGWMSAAAVANGGGIAAGSSVATMMSVGAAGLGTAATVATAGAGLVLCAGLAAGAVHLVPKLYPSNKKDDFPANL